MSIDAESSQMKLSGNIRTVYAPVQSWQEEFDPDDNHLRSPGKVFLTCEQLEMAQWSPRSNDQRVNEMLATGNAHIFSDTFEVTSDRISYDQDSDWLTIEGSPRTDANLWFKQTPNDKEPTHLVAEKIKYRLKDQMTETQGVKNLSINRN